MVAYVVLLYRNILGIVKRAWMAVSTKRRGRGRPVEKPVLAPTLDTPEKAARALVTTPSKDDGDWGYLKDREIQVAGAPLHRQPKKDQKANGFGRSASRFRV